MSDTLAQYGDGDLTDLEALRALALNLAEVESDLEPLEAERKALRASLERIVTRLGGRGEVPGFGALQMTNGGETVSYDREVVDAVMAELLASGDAWAVRQANRLARGRKISQRAGSLRITRERHP